MELLKSFRGRSSLLLGLANLTDVATSLVRGVGFAHLLSPEQFGLAITVSIIGGIVDLITDLGITPLAVRSSTRTELNTLHSLAMIRALLTGSAVAALGPVFSWVFAAPGTSSAYILIGLASFVRGCSNLEPDRRTRQYEYVPKVAALILSQLAWTTVSLTYAVKLHDFYAMAVGFLFYALTYAFCSHLFSKERWRLGWDPRVVEAALSYGRPLIVNGIATACASMGDRVFTGTSIGLTQLAHYTALSTSAFLPRAAVARYLSSVFTPHFVNAHVASRREHVGELWTLTVALIGGIFGLGFIAIGQSVTALVFGAKYHVAQDLVSIVGLLGTIRYMSVLPNPPCLAYGHNTVLARYTLFSLSGLVLGACALLLSQRLELLLGGMCIGEFGALIWVVTRVASVLAIPKRTIQGAIGTPLFIVAADAAVMHILPPGSVALQIGLSTTSACLLLGQATVYLRRLDCSFAEIASTLIPRA